MCEPTDADLLSVMNRICSYQVSSYSHALTCGRNDRHQNLFPIVIGRRIILRCPECDYRQEHIPTMFTHDTRLDQ